MINNLLQKQMSRKEFLSTVGFGLATICGLSAILHMLGQENPWVSAGYGDGTYGGRKKKATS